MRLWTLKTFGSLIYANLQELDRGYGCELFQSWVGKKKNQSESMGIGFTSTV